ncbi:hypothetical protein [Paraburkholderia sp. UCT31]|uniref:hypothetical protein n=1 Tax=Paraburkholderia sp. UCT31 TaxID=2615209 RepID=UPI001655C4FC|nr:hypothetical protein [Paraburkholderia sp. UCT31]
MFSLIITIISIALVALLALATLYYGGSAFSQGSAKAAASTVVSQAQQIAGANTLFANDNAGTFAATTAALQTGSYLSTVPTPPAAAATGAWAIAGAAANNVTLSLNGSGAQSICTAILKNAGLSTTIASGATAGRQVDCYGASAPYSFQFSSN